MAIPAVVKARTHSVSDVFATLSNEAIVATPPAIESVKSPGTKEPPPVVVKTASLNVTVSSEFAPLMVVLVIVGAACAKPAHKSAAIVKNSLKIKRISYNSSSMSKNLILNHLF